MTLPDYFLADLPPEARLTPDIVAQACHALKRNRERYLAGRSTAAIIKTLHTLGDNWLHDDYPFRRLALDQGPAATGFSSATLARGIDAFFRREVLPHVPDAWIDGDATKIGYEISFNRYFYKPQPLRTLAEIRADILALENETEGLLGEIVGGSV